jgi:glucose-1-phosphatase
MIKLFVFDLGNVILPFDNHRIAVKLKDRSTKEFTEEAIFHHLFDLHKGSINPYEEGLCSSLEFFMNVKETFGLNCDFEEFKDIWNNIFWENSGVGDIIRTIKSKGFPLFLLSNTNEMHFDYIVENYPIVRLMDEWILSYEVGAKKPKKAMFDAIFKRMDVKGDEVFYIDDVEDYVNHARLLGIQGFLFKNSDDLSLTLKDVL